MDENLHLMIKIAKLYYESGLTQETIAEHMRLSRPKVSRLLQEARQKGVVKISVIQEPGDFSELEQALEARFGLLEVVIGHVSEPDSPQVVSRELGIVAAKYLNRVVLDGDTIGLTWGTTLSAMVDHVTDVKRKDAVVVQLVGGLGEPDSEVYVTEMVRRLSVALGATLRLLPAPGIVKSAESAQLLRSDPYIAQALESAAKVNIAFVGIGTMTSNSLLVRGGKIITQQEVDLLKKAGAVGEISIHFYDVNGNPVHSEIDDRVIGISLDTLRSLPRVVGVAGGNSKFAAVLGAVRGRLINILITDPISGRKLLEAN